MTTNLGGEGQRVGCRACDVVFRDRTAESLALVPCPACGLQGEVISLPIPDMAQRLCGRGGDHKVTVRLWASA